MRSKSSTMMASIIGLAGLLLSLSSVHGQIMHGQPASGNVRFVYSHWNLEENGGTTEINQLTIPFTGFMPLRDNLEAVFYVANSSNNLERTNEDYSLSGLGDVRVQLNRSFNDDRLLLSVGFNLPTGKKKIDSDIGPLVLRILSQNYLTLPMRRFGEGFGFNVLLGGAQMLGELRCGAGVMYQFNGKYEPYEERGKYDPGDFISMNAGAEWQKDEMKLTFDAIFTTYTDDKLDGRKVFGQSTQVGLRLGAMYSGETYSVSGGTGYLVRGRNTTFSPDEDQVRIFGNEFWIYGHLARHFHQGWSITPSAELKLIGANDQGFGSSTIFGFGGAVGRTFGEQIRVGIDGKYFTGNADAIDLSGFQLTASLTANL